MPPPHAVPDHPPPERSLLPGPIRDESRLTAATEIRPGRRYGFFTDTTLCIGCKACEVACKTWNALPAEPEPLSGLSYDNTRRLSSSTWRHVLFVERIGREPTSPDDGAPAMPHFQNRWLMLSDVCKHCAHAPCVEACPTGALWRTEFDTVVVQADICNGCGYCVPACPFGVVELSDDDGKAHKCTLCYDRLKSGLEPACSKACPTDSIVFGELEDLHERAQRRVAHLRELGVASAYLYGAPDAGSVAASGGAKVTDIREGAAARARNGNGTNGERGDTSADRGAEGSRATGAGRGGVGGVGDGEALGGLNAFFLLTAPPATYNLPAHPTRASRRTLPGMIAGLATAAALVAAGLGVLTHG